MSRAHLCIVEYNTPALLEKCVRSALSQLDVEEITVFSNGQRHQHEFMKDLLFQNERSPDLPYLRSYVEPTNVGYAHALNFVISEHVKSSTQFFVALNADVWFNMSHDVRHMMDFMETNRVAIAGPKQVNSQGQITHAGIFGTDSKPKIRGWKEEDRGQYDDQRTDCISVSGSAYFIDVAAIETLTSCPDYRSWVLSKSPDSIHKGLRVSGLSSKFPTFLPTHHYYEETGLSYHARKHGYKIGYNGQVEIVHEWHQSSPVGGEVDRQMKDARGIFRDFCDWHDIEHD